MGFFFEFLIFFQNFYGASYIFSLHCIVLHSHYVICRNMFTVGLQYYFRQIHVTASVLAGRCKQLVFCDMLLFWCSWLKYRIIKLDLVTVGSLNLIWSQQKSLAFILDVYLVVLLIALIVSLSNNDDDAEVNDIPGANLDTESSVEVIVALYGYTL